MKEIMGAAESTASVFSGLRVLIVDDHHLVRAGLKLSLEELSQDVQILEADTLESAIERYRSCPVDLVLLDLSLPGIRGLAALESFGRSCPDARIVVVSAQYDMDTVQAAVHKGILGFIPKLSDKALFVNALRFVLEGGIYIPPEALLPRRPGSTPLPHETPQGTPAYPGLRTAELTERQMDVLTRLLDGKPNKQICRELNLAMGTVKCHVGAILDALKVSSRAEAIAAVSKRGGREWLERPEGRTAAKRD